TRSFVNIGAQDRPFALEQVPQRLLSDARASITHLQLNASAAPAQRDGDLPLERKLEGIGDKVEHNLLPHLAVNGNLLRQWRTIENQAKTGLLNGWTKEAGQLRRQERQVSRLKNGFAPASFDL